MLEKSIKYKKGHLPLEQLFGFCKTFKEIGKTLGFHLTFKTVDLQDVIFTTIATDINVTIKGLYLSVPELIAKTETQVMFNEALQYIHTSTYDSWYTKRKLSTDGNELQVDIGSAQHANSPKYLIASFQTEARSGVSNKANNIAIFDHVNVKKYFAEKDGSRYLSDGILTVFLANGYLDQYRDLIKFYKEYVGEELMKPDIIYSDMKKNYPIRVIDLRHKVDHITPKKIHLFQEFITDAANVNAWLFVIIIRHTQIEMISDGNKIIEAKLVKESSLFLYKCFSL